MTIITRAKNILLRPKTEWQAVAGEASSTGSLYLKYITPLAAIGPIASCLGMTVIGLGPFRMPLQYSLSTAVVSFVTALLSVFLIALVIDGLAHPFHGQNSLRQALKLAAYSFTPVWLSGILMLVPAFAVLALVAGLYAIYLLYLGLPVLMASPQQKSLPYTASVIVAALLIQMAFGSVTAAILGAPDVQPVVANQAAEAWTGLSASQQESLEKLKEVAAQVQAGQAMQAVPALPEAPEIDQETPAQDP